MHGEYRIVHSPFDDILLRHIDISDAMPSDVQHFLYGAIVLSALPDETNELIPAVGSPAAPRVKCRNVHDGSNLMCRCTAGD